MPNMGIRKPPYQQNINKYSPPQSATSDSNMINSLDSIQPTPNSASPTSGVGETRACTRGWEATDLTELAKVMCPLAGGAVLASPSIYSPHVIPPVYFYAALVLLSVAFFALLLSIFLEKAHPKSARLQALIGTACVAAAVPTMVAGLFPSGLIRLVVLLPFALLGVVLLVQYAIKCPSCQEVPEDDLPV